MKIFAETLEDKALEQIKDLYKSYPNNHIRVMPDAHAGKGCTIGTTMVIKDKISPSLVGVDIGCGITSIQVPKLNLNELQMKLEDNVPSGRNIHRSITFDTVIHNILNHLICKKEIDFNRALRSVGTLGGGNHFIEYGIDDFNDYWLTVHSGSRNLGVQVCKYYQKKNSIKKHKIEEIIKTYPPKERQKKIESLPEYDENAVIGSDLSKYIHDIKLVQDYALFNRMAIINILGMPTRYFINTVHNYIDDKNILRKGAVEATKNKDFLVSLNMKDGILICTGKSNSDWNYSCCHGAGRIMSRKQAKEKISLKDFKEKMEGVYSHSICKNTLDEAPMVYKDPEEIKRLIQPTAIIQNTIHPLFNFKATE